MAENFCKKIIRDAILKKKEKKLGEREIENKIFPINFPCFRNSMTKDCVAVALVSLHLETTKWRRAVESKPPFWPSPFPPTKPTPLLPPSTALHKKEISLTPTNLPTYLPTTTPTVLTQPLDTQNIKNNFHLIHAYACMHTSMYIHTYTHTCIHRVHTHTHTPITTFP